MSFRCPYCQSRDIQTFKPATRLSAAIGTIGGVTQGIDSFQKGMQIGAKTAAHSGYLGVVGGILLVSRGGGTERQAALPSGYSAEWQCLQISRRLHQ